MKNVTQEVGTMIRTHKSDLYWGHDVGTS